MYYSDAILHRCDYDKSPGCALISTDSCGLVSLHRPSDRSEPFLKSAHGDRVKGSQQRSYSKS